MSSNLPSFHSPLRRCRLRCCERTPLCRCLTMRLLPSPTKVRQLTCHNIHKRHIEVPLQLRIRHGTTRQLAPVYPLRPGLRPCNSVQTRPQPYRLDEGNIRVLSLFCHLLALRSVSHLLVSFKLGCRLEGHPITPSRTSFILLTWRVSPPKLHDVDSISITDASYLQVLLDLQNVKKTMLTLSY